MKEDIRVFRQPRIVFLMYAVVVQDHMYFFFLWHFSYYPIHELQEFHASLVLCCLRMNSSSRYFKCCKQIQCAMTSVGAFIATNNLDALVKSITLQTEQQNDFQCKSMGKVFPYWLLPTKFAL